MFAFSMLAWAISIIATGVAALVFLSIMDGALSAPQEAAGAASAIAIAVIPYCFARGIYAIVQLRALADERQARNRMTSK